MFKVEDGVLKIRKVDLPDIKVNIMGDLQQSYRKYYLQRRYGVLS